MKNNSLIMVALFCILPSLCIAEPTYKGKSCPPEGEAPSQVMMTACEGNLAEEADRDLNAVYQELYEIRKDSVQSDDASLLKNAELAWIKFRDNQCEWVANGSKGGTIQGQVIAQCKLLMTKQRIEELQRFLNCRDNDVFCGAH